MARLSSKNDAMNTAKQIDDNRFLIHPARDTLALILAGGQGTRLYELTKWRAKPSLYFGGKFRIIDFPLSNCFNSGIHHVGVLTQYKAHSLIRHLLQAWSRFQADNREFIEILPASQRSGGEWYRGTADAVYQNLDIIRTHNPRLVLILAGDHVYKMDYRPLLHEHNERDADLTICCIEVPIAEAAGALGVIQIDETGRVISFEEKPEVPKPIPGQSELCLASMGNYVFNTDFLYEQIIGDADNRDSTHDFGRDIIPSIIENYRVCSYRFRNPKTPAQVYWRDVGTLDAFWEANMELVSITPELDLYDQHWPIMTHQAQLAPAKFIFDEDDRRGQAIDSMVSGGCVISGAKIKRSLIFSNVRVRLCSEVKDSVVLPDVDIGRSCVIHRAIIDRGAIISDNTVIGVNPDADRARGYRVTDSGLTLVTPDMLGQQLHRIR
jgi:glucose-1-phosphate adenylyltransferase